MSLEVARLCVPKHTTTRESDVCLMTPSLGFFFTCMLPVRYEAQWRSVWTCSRLHFVDKEAFAHKHSVIKCMGDVRLRDCSPAASIDSRAALV